MANIEKMIASTFMEIAQGLETGALANVLKSLLQVWEANTEKKTPWLQQLRLQRMESMCTTSVH